jgi:hypothetical protein
MTADRRIDDTGPASPLILPKKLDGRGNVIENDVFTGLTKREHYASQALAALIQGYAIAYGSPTNAPDEVVREAISYADLLIAGLKAGA